MNLVFLDFLKGITDFLRGRSLGELVSKGIRLWQREGVAGFGRLYRDLSGVGYSDWIILHDTLTEADIELIDKHIETFSYYPMISVIMPVFNPPAVFLKKAIESVRKQRYPYWELCIADDASLHPEVREILYDAQLKDKRIRVTYRQQNGHISAATNTALQMASGDFIALLDQDDELAEHALYIVVAALNENSDIDLLYSDEDKIDARGKRFGHYFKPDWNPDLFLSQNLVCHLGVYRRTVAQRIGGFRTGYEGSQDWDFALRFVEATNPERISHLPYVLYHWRAIEGSTARTVEAKNYAVRSAHQALEDAWHRRGVEAELAPVEACHFDTRLPLPSPPPLVSVVICTRDHVDLLRNCIEGLTLRTDYPRLEVIVVDNGSDDSATLEYLATLHKERRIKLLHDDSPFNFAKLNNLAVRESRGQLLCLLNNDIEPIGEDWLRHMVAHVLRPEVGAVGAKLLYPDGTIQHGGVFLDGIAAGHLHLGYPRGSPGYGNRARLAQNFSAVTAACLVIRKSVWDEVNGMDEAFAIAFNDVDFCLRVQARGYRNLWLPQAELYHHESASRGTEDTPQKQARFAREVSLLQSRWRSSIENDPAWNPNLAWNGSRIGLASPPRLRKPWLA
jgi:GT2 family glycosyltransferase